jgi:hypothetical protein
MAMASLAWTLKAWFALVLAETGRFGTTHTEQKRRILGMEFRSFVNAFMRIPVQIVRQGRRLIYRMLAWSRSLELFLRGWDCIAQRC